MEVRKKIKRKQSRGRHKDGIVFLLTVWDGKKKRYFNHARNLEVSGVKAPSACVSL